VLISTHVASGALLGRAVGRPLPALLLGVASHLALDRLPHWGQGSGWPPQELDEQTFRVAVVDGLVGLALIALIARVVPGRHRAPVLAGIVGACAPDLDKPGRRFLGRSPWPERFDYVHATIQAGVESPDRLGQDVGVAAAGAAAAVAVLGEHDR
jgi:hypothetical protein